MIAYTNICFFIRLNEWNELDRFAVAQIYECIYVTRGKFRHHPIYPILIGQAPSDCTECWGGGMDGVSNGVR